MPFLSHAGVSLRYDRTGGGPAVFFLHGWTCNRGFWDRQLAALRGRFTVVAVDLRGHGESSPARTGYSIGALVADLEHLVRALAVPRLAVVGWSMGGVLAQALARRLGDRVTALGLVCTTAGGLTDAGNPLARPAEEVRATRAGVADDFRAAVRGIAARFFKAGEASPLFPWALGQMQKTAPHVALACLESLLAADLRSELATLAVPTTVFHGRHDTLLPPAHGEALAAAIPGARLVMFEESAHAPFLEEPEAFNAALLSLLTGERLPAPGAAAGPAPAAGERARPGVGKTPAAAKKTPAARPKRAAAAPAKRRPRR